MAAFQNVSIQSLYAVLLLYINYVDMQASKQCINNKSDAWLSFDCVTHWRRFKIKYIVYILCSGIMKHNTLFKHKATNILEVSLFSCSSCAFHTYFVLPVYVELCRVEIISHHTCCKVWIWWVVQTVVMSKSSMILSMNKYECL